MNRFTAEGIAQEAIAGKRVLVISPNVAANIAAMDDCEAALTRADDILRVSRLNGNSHIATHAGGSVTFKTHGRVGADTQADIVFIDAGVDEKMTNPDDYETLHHIVRHSAHAEIIRA